MTAPGWYPDPGGQPCLRWWDGRQWTAYTTATQTPATEPSGVSDDEPLPWIMASSRTTSQRPERPDVAVPDRAPSVIKAGRRARGVVREARQLVTVTNGVLAAQTALKRQVLDRFATVRHDLVVAHLATIPIERLKDATEGRLRLGAMRDFGYRTVADVVSLPPSRLQAVPGVGEQTAIQTVAAARHLAKTVAETIAIRLDADSRPVSHAELLRTLRAYDDADRLLSPLRDDAERLVAEVAHLIDASGRAASRWRWLFTGSNARTQAMTAARALDELLCRPATRVLGARLTAASGGLAGGRLDDAAVWADYEARAPDYYGLLGEIADLSLDVSAVHGHIPAELAAQIADQQLDTSWLTVSLRGYQAFAARFGLVQRRCIVGDEMGLGKTIEAIAIMTHLAALGATHFLVVCPASVLVNWTREVSGRSKLHPHSIHGNERTSAYRAWRRRGGVGVTTFDTLRHFRPEPDHGVALLVVDEAHFVKNPATLRAKEVRQWADACDRVVFLTGTPMENRVEEFRNLVRYLQPTVAARVDNIAGIAGAAHFRTAVSTVYLRRNQEDVLAELPERLDNEDWVDLSRDDIAIYREAVASGNFMAMRRAALLAGPGKSAKLQRLTEIVQDSRDSGWKVVVFSYFHDVLDVVRRSLDGRTFGPLTGGLAPPARQELVDHFATTPGHGVLLSQIQAGGTGLNIQAASVVVLTEPQWKPSTEEQAIARCHRMGQVRRVHVHRLLAQDCVDQRMLETLRAKQVLFEAYVRRSALKDVTPDAVDIVDSKAVKNAVTLADAEQQIIDLERERLGIVAPLRGRSQPTTVITKSSADASRPYANLLPIVEALVRAGNETREGGFVLGPVGWRCVMVRPLDLDYVEATFELPPNLSLSRELDSIHDRLSWSAIEGPGT